MQVQGNKATAIDISVNSQVIKDSYYSHVRITPPSEIQTRQRVAIICVLDISGSMDSEATQGQSKESDGFSRLDLVKHSVNTIVHSLQEGDYLGIVTFSNHARTDLVLTIMDKGGKDKALGVVKAMKTEGSTNLWDGIKGGLQMSKSPICDSKNTFVVVLSDGEPNIHPPEGNLGALQKYIATSPLNCSLSMFGYGYSLDTKLLAKMSELGAGCYGYIPDCSMVGTIFVNFLSLALSTFSTLMTVEVETKKGQLIQLNGIKQNSARMGSVQYGLTRNILIEHKGIKDGEEYATLKIRYGKNLRSQFDLKLTMKPTGEIQKLKTQICRWKYINFLQNATDKCNAHNIKESQELCKNLVNEMKKIYSKNKDQYLEAMIKDIDSPQDQQGQVSIALKSDEYWKKWGKHYFPALRIAHIMEICTNFKDPGLQKYCGLLFREIENNIDTVFIQLPPPQPTIKKYDAQGNVKQVHNMANYYNQSGGCIGGDCLAQLANGKLKKIRDLTPSDIVLTKLGPSRILCILTTQVNQTIPMVRFPGGLLITPYHPIYINKQWKFPIDIKNTENIYMQKYYNFVLEVGHVMKVNGMDCVTLGHGFKGDVIEHEYLGSERVVQDLKGIRGWKEGRVIVEKRMVRRDPITKVIMGIGMVESSQLIV